MKKNVRIATRKSPLALWQAEYVKAQLEKNHPDISVELVKMVTQGDIILDTPLAKIGGKGLFVKELEQGMLAGKADIAVHSMKDVPMQLPEGFELATICPRDNPYDAFVSNQYDNLVDLPKGAKIGTSSLRRRSQLLNKRPDLEIIDLRGNVNTRLKKLDEGQYDAIILAAAGLIRLNMADRIKEEIKPDFMLPAVGQGAVGIEVLQDDTEMINLLAPLHCLETADRVMAERAMNLQLEGGCQVPIGGFAELVDEQIHLRALVGAVDGSRLIQVQATGERDQATTLGTSLGRELLSLGADKLLKEVYSTK